jgi:hypothetical protein
MFGSQPYDRFGHTYKVSQVLTTQDTFNLTAYEEYSPLYLPAAFTVTYLLAFALSTCVIVHTLLYHGRTLLNGFKRIRTEDEDIHLKLMQNYPEVPDWWYGAVFVFFFCLAVVAAEVRAVTRPCVLDRYRIIYDIGLGHGYARLGINTLRHVTGRLCATIGLYLCDDWSSGGFTHLHMASLCRCIDVLPYSQITVNLLAQIIPGTLLPGQPFSNMIFKAYSVQTLTEATSFVQDLKLGHYIKVPPRATFIGAPHRVCQDPVC